MGGHASRWGRYGRCLQAGASSRRCRPPAICEPPSAARHVEPGEQKKTRLSSSQGDVPGMRGSVPSCTHHRAAQQAAPTKARRSSSSTPSRGLASASRWDEGEKGSTHPDSRIAATRRRRALEVGGCSITVLTGHIFCCWIGFIGRSGSDKLNARDCDAGQTKH